MKRKVARVASLALIGATVGAAGIHAPANADSVTILDSTCYSPSVCMWEDDGYYGDRYEFFGRDEHAREIGGFNGDNEISSVKNRTKYSLCIYADDEQKGNWIRLAPNAYVPSLDDSHDFDNDAESFQLTNGNC